MHVRGKYGDREGFRHLDQATIRSPARPRGGEGEEGWCAARMRDNTSDSSCGWYSACIHADMGRLGRLLLVPVLTTAEEETIELSFFASSMNCTSTRSRQEFEAISSFVFATFFNCPVPFVSFLFLSTLPVAYLIYIVR